MRCAVLLLCVGIVCCGVASCLFVVGVVRLFVVVCCVLSVGVIDVCRCMWIVGVRVCVVDCCCSWRRVVRLLLLVVECCCLMLLLDVGVRWLCLFVGVGVACWC